MDRRIKVLMAVHKLTVDNGPPSYDEIKDVCGISTKSLVSADVEVLVERGWLTKTKGKARSLRITGAGKWQIAYTLLPDGQKWALIERRCPACGTKKAYFNKGVFRCKADGLPIYGGKFWAEALERAEQAAYEIGGEQ